jgi:hypothetical protein
MQVIVARFLEPNKIEVFKDIFISDMGAWSQNKSMFLCPFK